ncbi:hypothetical protein [Acinetobacter sp. CFCC 10889]|uniref:hypothetical protein n=1 Tax=Acinetobacter sp. CFCC 10889 TaxID=1775557 RepID=UPI000DCFC893|nr:hypothetical protein [Acinetobacter sp. CFCC 10889]
MKSAFWGFAVCGIFSTSVSAMGYSSEYFACMNNAQASTTQAALCMKSELKQQTKRYEYFADIHVKVLPKEQQKSQETINKKWLTLRDEHCLIKNLKLSVGHASKYYSCALKKTQAQADLLEKQAYKYR